MTHNENQHHSESMLHFGGSVDIRRVAPVWIKGLFLLAVFLALPLSAHAYTCTLTWDANTEADLSGYRLYLNDVAVPPDVPAQSNTTINECQPGDVFHLTAFDTVGNESVPSDPVTVRDTVAPAAPFGLGVVLSP